MRAWEAVELQPGHGRRGNRIKALDPKVGLRTNASQGMLWAVHSGEDAGMRAVCYPLADSATR